MALAYAECQTTPVEGVARDMNLALDGVGGETMSSSLAALRHEGALIALAGPPPQEQA